MPGLVEPVSVARLLSLAEDQETLKEVVKSLQSKTVIDFLDKADADTPKLLHVLLKGGRLDDKEGARSWQTVVRHVLVRMNDGSYTDKICADIVHFLVSEAERFPCLLLQDINRWFQDAVSEGRPVNAKALEVLTKALLLLEAQETVEVPDGEGGFTSGSGPQYKAYYVSKILKREWRQESIIHLASFCRDITLAPNQLEMAINKIVSQFDKVEVEELPLLVYQLLLLAAKGNKWQALEGIIGHMDHLHARCDDSDLQQQCVTKEQVRRVMGTVMLHINFAIMQDQELGKEYLKHMKAGSTELLTTFNLALCLSMSRIHRFEAPVLEFLKGAIMKSYRDARYRSVIHWIDEPLFRTGDIGSRVLSIIEYGWDDAAQGLVQLAAVLLDSCGPKAGAATPQAMDNEQCARLGSSILREMFKAHDIVRSEVLDLVLSRVVTKTTGGSTHYATLLKSLVLLNTRVVLEYQTKVIEHLDYLSYLSLDTARELFAAIQPLFGISVSFRDSVLLMLRKAMFNREEGARQVAAMAVMQILQRSRVLEDKEVRERADEVLSCSQQSSQSSMAPVPSALDNRALCYEIFGSARRFLTQQASVRHLVYAGFQTVLESNPMLHQPVTELIMTQVMTYYEEDKDSSVPLQLEKCIETIGGQVQLREPVAHLLACASQCVVFGDGKKMQLDDDGEESAQSILKGMLDSMVTRMCKCEMEDFELDKSADYTQTTSSGVTNNIRATLLVAVYEVLMEYVMRAHKASPQSCETIVKLFERRQTLQDVLKEKVPAKGFVKKIGGAPKDLLSATLSLQCVSQMVQLVVDDEGANEHARNTLRECPDLVKFLLKLSRTLLQKEAGQGGESNGNQWQLYEMAECVGESTIKCYMRGVLKEPFLKGIGPLLLESYQAALGTVTSRCPNQLVGFLAKTNPQPGREEEQTNDVTVAIHRVVDVLQRLVGTVGLEEPDPGTNSKEASILVAIIGDLAAKMDRSHALYGKVEEWIEEVCNSNNIADGSLSKALVALMLAVTNHSQAGLELVRLLGQSVHGHLGDICEDEKELDKGPFMIVNSQTANTVAGQMIGSMEAALTDMSWLLGKLRLAMGAKDAEEHGEVRRSTEATVMLRLGIITAAMDELVQACLTGAVVEPLTKVLKQFYDVMGSLVKYFLSVHTAKLEWSRRQLSKLIQASGGDLSQHFYFFITYLQLNDSENARAANKKKSQASAKARIMRESKLIPNVIYSIEQFERLLIQLSKKAKVNLMKHVKRSTARDFRIQQQELEVALQQEGSEEEDEKKEKGKKRSGTQGQGGQKKKKQRTEEEEEEE